MHDEKTLIFVIELHVKSYSVVKINYIYIYDMQINHMNNLISNLIIFLLYPIRLQMLSNWIKARSNYVKTPIKGVLITGRFNDSISY